ncbi:calcium/sodium antiporter [bacterium]|jgi:cation:H+ antiporter|nr:calcium/sodium antiporter [bacterium]MBT4250938.1 calcium/sodium antiporter [bacterium]MBT4597874.1 calcium/sodium antiporter [bacterium]MBT6753934.1 calcium/sodium antiporter [bacterium]MBT7037363.1 calcium/sodium antiporter [bacterium]
MEIIIWTAIFFFSLTILVKASDFFTDAAEEIGLFFKLQPFLIGVTIVALGTSLPELVSSLFALHSGASEIVSGNVVGSNITNICLVLGITAVVGKKMKLDYEILNVDLPLLISSAFILGITIYDGKFTFWEAVLCLVGIIIYFVRIVSSEKKGEKAKQKGEQLEKYLKKELHWTKKIPIKEFITLIIAGVFIFLSAKYTVDAAVKVSELLNIGAEIIAASIIALGTSLPELAVSLTAAKKGKAEIAVGNILGSNIFNALGVMGITGLFGVLIIPQSILIFGLPLMVITTFVVLFVTQDKEVTKWEGYFLLLFYVFYIGKIFNIL